LHNDKVENKQTYTQLTITQEVNKADFSALNIPAYLLTELKWKDIKLKVVENRVMSERKHMHQWRPQDFPGHCYLT